MTVTLTDLARSLSPILQRVRTDVTAVKTAAGHSAWTDQPLTPDRLNAHLVGHEPRGVCPIKPQESTTRLALLDLDSHRGESSWDDMTACAQDIIDLFDTVGLRCVPWRSSGGRGIHLFLLWDEPQDTYSVRQTIFDALGLLGLSSGTRGVMHGEVEVFPKQDSVGLGEYGNQFILPLAGKSEPLDTLMGLAPMGREWAVQVDWLRSDPVRTRQVPVRTEVVASSDSVPIAEVTAALAAIPNDRTDYDWWRDLAFAVHEATGGSDEGREAFVQWSAQNPDFDEKFFEQRVWPYIKTRPGGVSRATLFAQARQHGHGVAVMDTSGFEDVQVAVRTDIATPAAPAITTDQWLAAIRDSEDIGEIQNRLCKRIAADRALGDIQRSLLADALQAKLSDLGAQVSIAIARKLVAFRPEKSAEPTVLEKRPLTEFGNAERMLDKFGSGLMYVPEITSWFVWSGVYWRKAAAVEIEHCAKETIKALAAEAESVEDDKLAEFFEFCKFSQAARMVRNMVTLAASDPRVCVPVRELDKHAHLLGVRNGVVDLTSGALLPPDPALRITIVAGCDYKPGARAPLFMQTLKDVFMDDMDMVQYVLRACGYALQGNPREDLLFIAFGQGSNGKSTVFNLIRKVFGGYAKTADATSFVADGKQGGGGGAREDLLRLRGARFVYCSEPEEGGELREGMVKSMTGGDAIVARGLYATDSVEFVPTWAVFMPTNHKPIIKGSDNGIWRRMELIPFERNFENDPHIKKDEDREEKLARELEGVLALLVAAGLDYRRSGLSRPEKVRMAREVYRGQMDLLAEWLDECCEVGAEHKESMQRLWVSWENFAKSRGLLRYVTSSAALGRRLDARFPSGRGSGGVRMRSNIRLKEEF